MQLGKGHTGNICVLQTFCRNLSQCHTRFILSNVMRPKSPVLYTKKQGHQPYCSVYRPLDIYGFDLSILYNSGGHFVQWNRTAYAIVVKGHTGNICVLQTFCRNLSQCHTRFILSNVMRPKSPVLYTKKQGHQPYCSVYRPLDIYGFDLSILYNSGGHFVQWNRTAYAIVVKGHRGKRLCVVILQKLGSMSH